MNLIHFLKGKKNQMNNEEKIDDRLFSRWESKEKSTWVFQVYKSYDNEIRKNLVSFFAAADFTYKMLGKNGAKWNDRVSNHMQASDLTFNNLKEWSDSFNNYKNWSNQNLIMGISSNFETYFSTVVSLAIKSNPGILFGTPKIIDGIDVLKNGKYSTLNIDNYVMSVTKGDWNSRVLNFEKIFGEVPQEMKDNVKILEDIRRIRNNIGHAFGRDIEESRKHIKKTVLPTEKISKNKALKYRQLTFDIAKSIDLFLLKNHIGEFQVLQFYHELYQTLSKNGHYGNRAFQLRKKIGATAVRPLGKTFCHEVVKYYEEIVE